MSCLSGSFYRKPTAIVARDLIGKTLVRIIKSKNEIIRLAGIIVETEAYGFDDDLASHACMGPTPRNRVMFGEVGRAYVYFTYGNHFCVNVSARSTKVQAGAVLIRGIEPVQGIDFMRQFRPVDDILSLTSGPGKLTRALKITSALNGVDMTDPTSELYIESGKKPEHILATPRIGITRATDKEWRFVDPSSPYVSKKIQIKSL
ncbi:MAG: DNA-3-methyladenine glycosylase [Thermoproteota archaeon]